MTMVCVNLTSLDTRLTSTRSALALSSEVLCCIFRCVLCHCEHSGWHWPAGYFVLDKTHLGKRASHRWVTQHWQCYRRDVGPGSLLCSFLYVVIPLGHACNLCSNLLHRFVMAVYFQSCMATEVSLSFIDFLSMYYHWQVLLHWVCLVLCIVACLGLTILNFKLDPVSYLVLCGWGYYILSILNQLEINIIGTNSDVCIWFSLLRPTWRITDVNWIAVSLPEISFYDHT